MATGAHQCVACGAVPTRACSTQCPKCAGRVYVCAKACQRRWWAQHKALCQVLPAPTAEPAPDEKAAALVRLDPDVAEHIWCGLGPADVARVSGAARALLGVGRPARRCMYAVSSPMSLTVAVPSYVDPDAENMDGTPWVPTEKLDADEWPRLVQPNGRIDEPKQLSNSRTKEISRCKTFVTKRHMFCPSGAKSDILRQREAELANTHCQACGEKEMWRFAVSTFSVAIPPGKGPGDTFVVHHAVPSVKFAPRRQAILIPDNGPCFKIAGATPLEPAPSARTKNTSPGFRNATMNEMEGIYGERKLYNEAVASVEPVIDSWRVPPGKSAGDEMQGTFYKGAATSLRYFEPGADPYDLHEQVWSTQIMPGEAEPFVTAEDKLT